MLITLRFQGKKPIIRPLNIELIAGGFNLAKDFQTKSAEDYIQELNNA